jgi:hypothetical protein
MKIDFKQLAKVEKQFRIGDSNISLNTLQTMVDLVLNPNVDAMGVPSSNIVLAMTTLRELGILKDEGAAQQLNS